MDIHYVILIFFYGQLWCSPLSAEIKGTPTFSLPATFQAPTTVRTDLRDKDTVKNEGPPVPTVTPTTAQENKSQDGHIIGAVVTGIILVGMIVAIVSIFLWKRLRRTDLADPHWAGRSPFADGDAIEIATDKELMQSSKRASILSVLPWKFTKNTLLLENVEGPPSEPAQSLSDPSANGADKRSSQSSPTATENSSSSSTSLQTPASCGPSSLTNIPLPPGDLFPELANLPPPPSWVGEVSEDPCPNGPGPFPFHLPAEALCPAPPDPSCGNPEEASPLPLPPKDFF
ncbi:protein EVI2B [Sphaerodactylus townsendi]|uniref:protein EVI2B n=1 Tax=Sphaerodactylus townsendi TaxID=933632 RepID=UPI00202765AE|nr:protein EVI2B [Sphaerodactylus townsendi]